MHSMHSLSIWSSDVREFEYELFTDDFFIRKVLEGFIRMVYTQQLPQINMLYPHTIKYNSQIVSLFGQSGDVCDAH